MSKFLMNWLNLAISFKKIGVQLGQSGKGYNINILILQPGRGDKGYGF